jgi:hypothetical protein
MKDARSQARRLKIREAVSVELARWDRATERRADAEYALEEFEEAGLNLSPEELEHQREQLRKAIQAAKREVEDARLTWYKAMERAEQEIPR